jgi:D-aminopeptidase
VKRPRARDIDIDIGIFEPGSLNAITDVAGVSVGHMTLIEGDGPLVPGEGPIRTGVTIILPRDGDLFRDKVQAGCYVLNGFGKSTGFHQVRELGTIETPIALTNTLNVPIVADALVEWSCAQSPEIGISTGTVNPVVGDINDGFLNDIQGRHVKKSHVIAAIAAAGPGPVPEGNVGGGTGCSCLGYKGGIGTSSRFLPGQLGGWTIGVLTQTNFGGILSVNGAPVGRELGVHDFADGTSVKRATSLDAAGNRDGSCMITIATDAPVDSRLLTRLARRAGLGLARTGFYSSNGSGDFFIAFSTTNPVPHFGARAIDRSVLADEAMSALFAALVEAVEESVINSLLAAETMIGRDGHARRALDIDELVRILDKYNARGWARKLRPR